MANQQVISKCAGLVAANDIKLSAITQNKMGGNTVYVNRDGKLAESGSGKLHFQVSDVDIPFGVSAYQGEDKNVAPRKSVDISFRNLESKPKLSEFHRFIKEIDEVVIGAVADGTLTGGVTKSYEVAKEKVRPSIRVDESGKYADTMKFNVTDNTKLFVNKESREALPVEMDSIPKGSKADLIVELSSIYMIGKNNIGVTYRVNQIRLRSSAAKLQEYAFVDDSDDEDDLNSEVTSVHSELPLEERRMSYVEYPNSP